MPNRIPLDRLNQLAQERILILDGAMGTMIQRHQLTEADYRGDRFVNHPSDLAGNHDLLVLTQTQIIASIHRQYLDAGADIIETNTFNANALSQSVHGLESLVYDLNYEAARIARSVADEVTAQWPSKPRLVAGSMGPTNRTLSMAPDVTGSPINVTFDEMRAAYVDQVRGLIDGGADLLLLETIIDALNAQAAIVAIEDVQKEKGVALPLMISFTITDQSGRIRSGQTVDAFYQSIAHVRPWSIGINCAPGAADMRPYLAELSRIADCWVTAYPNAGLPNASGAYGQSPAETAALLKDFAEDGFVNVLGGCCGTTAAHIRAIADAVKDARPRVKPSRADTTARLDGLLSLEQARAHCLRTDWDTLPVPVPWFVGHRIVSDQRLEELVPFIDWTVFGDAPRELYDSAQAMLKRIVKERKFQARAVYGFWPANSDGDDIVVYRDDGRREELTRFQMLRQQERIAGNEPRRSLADFIAPKASLIPDYIGAFAVTTGIGVDALVNEYEAQRDDNSAAITKMLAVRLAEAFAEFLHKQARDEWGYGTEERLSAADLVAGKYRGIRPAFGCPACPDRSGKPALFKLLGAPNLGIRLTENFDILPAASVSGLYFSHPDAKHFSVGRIGRDQLEDYAKRKGISLAEAERWLRPNL